MGKLEDEIEALLSPGVGNCPPFQPGDLVTAERLNQCFDSLARGLAAQRAAILRLAREIDDSRY